MAAVREAKRRLEGGGAKVRDQECDRALDRQPGEVRERPSDVRSARSRIGVEEVADDRERVAASLARRDEPLDPVREEDRADAVVVADRREREDRRDLRSDLALGPSAAAEQARGGDIDEEHERQLALLDVALDEGAPGPRRHVPVDRPHVVAVDVLADLGELHAAPLEDAVVLAAHSLAHEAIRPDLDAPDRFEAAVGDFRHPWVREPARRRRSAGRPRRP